MTPPIPAIPFCSPTIGPAFTDSKTLMSKWRTAQAFFLAPIVVPFVLMLPLPGRGAWGDFSLTKLFEGLLIYVLYSLPIAYAAELLLGLPTWMLFKRYGVRSLFAFAAAGALLGLLVYLVIEGFVAFLAQDRWTSVYNSLSSLSPFLPMCVIAGTASAITFRAIAFSGTQTEGPK
jgi:hypothetical protein